MSDGPPADVLWMTPDALPARRLEALRAAVWARRGRDLVPRGLFVDGTPAELAREPAFQATERLFIAGGDGSVHLAADALREFRPPPAQVPLAVLPLGTGNDFARALELPLDNWEALLECATGEAVRAVDAGEINGALFVNAVTIGFGAEATRDLPSALKSVVGGVSYAALTTWKALIANPFTLTVTHPGGRWEGEVIALNILNGQFVGGGLRAGIQSRFDDGQLDLLILPAVTAANLPEVVEDWMHRESAPFELFEYLQLGEATLETSRPVAVSTDGESSEADRFQLTCRPGSLRFVAPTEEE